MNDTEVSRRHSNSSRDDEGPKHENEGKTQFFMATENRRKEEREAKTKDSGRNLVQPTNSAMVDKAERDESLLQRIECILAEPSQGLGVVSSLEHSV